MKASTESSACVSVCVFFESEDAHGMCSGLSCIWKINKLMYLIYVP